MGQGVRDHRDDRSRPDRRHDVCRLRQARPTPPHVERSRDQRESNRICMTGRARKVALTAHVVASVGWIGAALVFLGLSVIGLRSDDPQTVRGIYLVMEPAAGLILLPLAFASLITGIVQSLITPWGLFRHYWVVWKLAITMFSVIMLVTYMKTFRAMAAVAS